MWLTALLWFTLPLAIGLLRLVAARLLILCALLAGLIAR